MKWHELTAEQRHRFLMGGAVQFYDWYIEEDLSESIVYTPAQVNAMREQVRGRGLGGYYQDVNSCLYQALDEFPIRDKQVGIIGSNLPWYEAVCLEYGAWPITIDYNPIRMEHPDLQFVSVAEYDANPRPFDVLFSISTFEHSGLGRYGDPIDPDGDLKAMKKAFTMLSENGILFLAVPVGKDWVCWNAHRVYGPNRLPLLLSGFKELKAYNYCNLIGGGGLGNQSLFMLGK